VSNLLWVFGDLYKVIFLFLCPSSCVTRHAPHVTRHTNHHTSHFVDQPSDLVFTLFPPWSACEGETCDIIGVDNPFEPLNYRWAAGCNAAAAGVVAATVVVVVVGVAAAAAAAAAAAVVVVVCVVTAAIVVVVVGTAAADVLLLHQVLSPLLLCPLAPS
jgi:hypothetical protein